MVSPAMEEIRMPDFSETKQDYHPLHATIGASLSTKLAASSGPHVKINNLIMYF
jgi:hypothetical protein